MYVIAVGKNAVGDIMEALMGQVPWQGLEKVSLDRIAELGAEVENMELTFEGKLIAPGMSIEKYSTYDVATGKFLRKSIFILGKHERDKADGGTIYLGTDGTKFPMWHDIEGLRQEILHSGAGLSNVRMVQLESGYSLEPLKGSIPDLEYRETSLQLRSYIKRAKASGIDV